MTNQFDRIGFAERFREIVNTNDLSIKQVAGRANIYRSAIYRFMNAESLPAAETLAKICMIYNVSANYLLFGKEHKHDK